MRYPIGDLFGQVMAPTADRRTMEVYIPRYGCCVYAHRKIILPVRPDRELLEWEAGLYYDQQEQQQQQRTIEGQCEEAAEVVTECGQTWNLNLPYSQDPNWVNMFDFTVPPPQPMLMPPTHPMVLQPPTQPILPQQQPLLPPQQQPMLPPPQEPMLPPPPPAQQVPAASGDAPSANEMMAVGDGSVAAAAAAPAAAPVPAYPSSPVPHPSNVYVSFSPTPLPPPMPVFVDPAVVYAVDQFGNMVAVNQGQMPPTGLFASDCAPMTPLVTPSPTIVMTPTPYFQFPAGSVSPVGAATPGGQECHQ